MKPNTYQPKDDLKSLPLPELEKNLGLGETQKEKPLAEKTCENYTDGG